MHLDSLGWQCAEPPAVSPQSASLRRTACLNHVSVVAYKDTARPALTSAAATNTVPNTRIMTSVAGAAATGEAADYT